jgi:hypothetical protein
MVVIAACVLLVGASVADDTVPAGSRVLTAGLVRRPLAALAPLPASRVAGRCPLPFQPVRGAIAETRGGRGLIPDSVLL